MMNDEIIVELRATKLKLAEQAGFDIHRLVAQIRIEEAQSASNGVQVLQPLVASASAGENQSKFQRIRFTHS
jgi:hypothetical protein